MFWYLFIFCRHSPRKPDEIACDYDHGDYFIPGAHTGNCVSQN